MVNEKKISDMIYPSIITFLGDWRKMVRDVKDLGLSEISLFLTGAGFHERKEIYQALEKAKVRKIFHVHIRHDMKEAELDYLADCFKSKFFTVHYQYLKFFEKSKYKKNIYVETNAGIHRIRSLRPIKKIGGICVDLSHIQHFINLKSKEYEVAKRAAKFYKVGCNHLSAVRPGGVSWHHASSLAELDYVADLPKEFFSPCVNIELANPIRQQLEFKKYIAKILAKQWNKKHVLR